MKTTITLPEKIKVGFQKREGTYTGKLAYVIYYDNKGVLRKETSWNSWRDEKIEPEEYTNTPTDGFVINKKVGGYSNGWNHRNTYIRIYDPRGFEFEITSENLLFILEHNNSIKGKGLEGQFIYGWDGKDNVLLPIDCPDYLEIKSFNDKVNRTDKVEGKNLKIGGIYLNNRNEEVIFMGRFDYHNTKWIKNPAYDGNASGEVRRWIDTQIEVKYTEKCYCFYKISQIDSSHCYLEAKKSGVSKYIIATVSEECSPFYSKFYEKLEVNSHFSPIDKNRTAYEKVEDPETLSRIYSYGYYTLIDGKLVNIRSMYSSGYGYTNNKSINIIPSSEYTARCPKSFKTYPEAEFTKEKMKEDFPPYYKLTYLQNGKLYSKEYH